MASEPEHSGPRRPMTPDEVRQTTFRQSQLAWRGYSEDEVDAFKNMMADYMVHAEKERTALRAEIERLRNFYREHGSDVDMVGNSRRRRHPSEIQDLVRRVNDYTEIQLGRAREYADLVHTRADEQADQLLYHTEVRSAMCVEEWLRTRYESGYAVGVAELRQTLQWLRAFSYALQSDLKVVDDALVHEGRRQEPTVVPDPPLR